jgi:ABC-2 type transport system ATP-binding protein
VLGGGYAVEVEAHGGVRLAERLAALPGVRAVDVPAPGRFRMTCDRDLRGEAAAEVVAGGGRLTQLSLDHPSLETIYTRYFQNTQEVPHAA